MVVYSPILILQGRSFFIRGHFPGIQGHTHQRCTQGGASSSGDTSQVYRGTPIRGVHRGWGFFIREHFPGIQGHTHQRCTQGGAETGFRLGLIWVHIVHLLQPGFFKPKIKKICYRKNAKSHNFYSTNTIKANKICHKQQLTGKKIQQIMFSPEKYAQTAIKFRKFVTDSN